MPVIGSKGYKINFGKTAMKSLSSFLNKNDYSAIYIVADENTATKCLPYLISNCHALSGAEIIEVESGEASKSIEIATLILQTLVEHKADTKTLLLNLGGGVVSDLGGFIASIYKRGIHFINIPTSLLAMADASVGGKTGIDFSGIKNVLGTFSQPAAVFIDPAFLSTLPERHIRNGLAEIYKIALVSDKLFWEELRAHELTMDKTILKSLQLKNAIVIADPFDRAERKILNFGHSIGHAIESWFLERGKDQLHGECVVAGMLIESHIAFQKKMLSGSELAEITRVLSDVFTAPSVKDISVGELLMLMGNDKKNSGQRFLFSLPDRIGSCKYNIEVAEEEIHTALHYFNSL